MMDFDRRTDYRLKREKGLLMKTNNNLLSYSSQTAAGGGRITDISLEHNLYTYLGVSFNVQKAILRYCSRVILEVVSIITELRRNKKRKSEEIEEMIVGTEDGTIFFPSILLLK